MDAIDASTFAKHFDFFAVQWKMASFMLLELAPPAAIDVALSTLIPSALAVRSQQMRTDIDMLLRSGDPGDQMIAYQIAKQLKDPEYLERCCEPGAIVQLHW